MTKLREFAFWLILVIVCVVMILALPGCAPKLESHSCTAVHAEVVIDAPFSGIVIDRVEQGETMIYTRDFDGWKVVTTARLVEGYIPSEVCK